MFKIQPYLGWNYRQLRKSEVGLTPPKQNTPGVRAKCKLITARLLQKGLSLEWHLPHPLFSPRSPLPSHDTPLHVCTSPLPLRNSMLNPPPSATRSPLYYRLRCLIKLLLVSDVCLCFCWIRISELFVYWFTFHVT